MRSIASCAGYESILLHFAPSHHHRHRHARDECCGPGRSPQLVYAHPVSSRTGFWVMVSLRPSRSGPTVVAWFVPSPLNFNGWIPPRGARGGQPPTLAPGPPAVCCSCAGWALSSGIYPPKVPLRSTTRTSSIASKASDFEVQNYRP